MFSNIVEYSFLGNPAVLLSVIEAPSGKVSLLSSPFWVLQLVFIIECHMVQVLDIIHQYSIVHSVPLLYILVSVILASE